MANSRGSTGVGIVAKERKGVEVVPRDDRTTRRRAQGGEGGPCKGRQAARQEERHCGAGLIWRFPGTTRPWALPFRVGKEPRAPRAKSNRAKRGNAALRPGETAAKPAPRGCAILWRISVGGIGRRCCGTRPKAKEHQDQRQHQGGGWGPGAAGCWGPGASALVCAACLRSMPK